MCLIRRAMSREAAAIMRCMRFNEHARPSVRTPARTNSRKCISTLIQRYRFSEHSLETEERAIGVRNLETRDALKMYMYVCVTYIFGSRELPRLQKLSNCVNFDLSLVTKFAGYAKRVGKARDGSAR